MWLVEVIPVSRAIPKENLSYYTKTKIPPGALISVPLRKKEIKAIVVSSKNVSSFKSELKKESFLLKKISDPSPKYLFSNHFFESAKEVADFSLHSTGSALYSLIPKVYLENFEDFLSNKKIKQTGDVHEKYILQSTEEERFAHYKSICREQIAKKKSVVFVSPTSVLAEFAYKKLSKGIDDYCHLVYSSQSKKKLQENLNNVLTSKKPVIMVTTGKFLSIPIASIGAIILDRENSSFYKDKRRPFLDIRDFAEVFSKKINTKLFFGDLYLRTETLWRAFEGELVEFVPVRTNLNFSNKVQLVDMKVKNAKSKNFKIAGKELENLIKKSIKEKTKIFLFTARRGLHPVTVCGDCGETVLCARCSSPVVLHKAGSKNFFLCHKCGRSRSAEERCKKCNSWKLVPLGVGVELLEKRLKENFKNINVFRIDGDNAPTTPKAKKIYEDFSKQEHGILIGTEKALSFLEEVDYSGIVSMDSFFSIPDFRINEKILNLSLLIREKTGKEMIIQTRDMEQGVLEYIKSGYVMDFYRKEIKERELFNFPPFVEFVKISFSGTRQGVLKEGERLKEYFEGFDISVYASFVSKLKNKFVRNALIKVPRESWVDKKLKEKILSLPPKFAVDVNPDNLL